MWVCGWVSWVSSPEVEFGGSSLPVLRSSHAIVSYNSVSSHSLSVRDEDEFLITQVCELHDNPVIFLRRARIARRRFPIPAMYHDLADSWYDLGQLREPQLLAIAAFAGVKAPIHCVEGNGCPTRRRMKVKNVCR